MERGINYIENNIENLMQCISIDNIIRPNGNLIKIHKQELKDLKKILKIIKR
jgi:hypothetical protein